MLYFSIKIASEYEQKMPQSPTHHYQRKRRHIRTQTKKDTLADLEGGTEGLDTPPHTHTLKNHKNIGFQSNTGPDPMTNHKAIKPAFNVGPSSVRQQNALLAGRRWPAYSDIWLVLLSLSSTKKQNKKRQRWTPSNKTPLISAWGTHIKARIQFNP